jgi:hypothetical protein
MNYKQIKYLDNDSSDDQIPIRIVSATRETVELFDETMLGRSISYFSRYFNVELLVESENKQSICKVYNEAIEFSKNNPAILVFVHDDVMILDPFWNKILRNSLQKFDIIGLAGSTRRHPKQTCWCKKNIFLEEFEDEKYLSGIVSHGTKFPPNPEGIRKYGEIGKECKLMDGLFLAIDSRKLIDKNLRFDERFDFHFYDLDFCRQAEILNLTMGTAPISVIHGSVGNLSTSKHVDNYMNMSDIYLNKWKN